MFCSLNLVLRSVKEEDERRIELRAGSLRNSTSGFLAWDGLMRADELMSCLFLRSILDLRS